MLFLFCFNWVNEKKNTQTQFKIELYLNGLLFKLKILIDFFVVVDIFLFC